MRTIRWLIACAVIAILIFVGITYRRYRQKMERAASVPAESSPDVFRDFRFQRVRGNRVELRFHAARYTYQSPVEIAGETITIELPGAHDTTTVIRARKGTWHIRRERAHLWDNVVIQYRGLRIRTTDLRYASDHQQTVIPVPLQWSWPERNWRGRADRGLYRTDTHTILLSGHVRMTWQDAHGMYRLHAPRMVWDLDSHTVRFPDTTRVVGQVDIVFQFQCGVLEYQRSRDGTVRLAGNHRCQGEWQTTGDRFRWRAPSMTLTVTGDGRRQWDLLRGRILWQGHWWIRAARLHVNVAPDAPITIIGTPDALTLIPAPRAPFSRNVHNVRTARLIVQRAHADTPTRIVLPEPWTMELTRGILHARRGQYAHDTWQAEQPRIRTRDGWQIAAETLTYRDPHVVLRGTVRGTGSVRAQPWTLEADTMTWSDASMQWQSHVRIRTPDMVLNADTWTWDGDRWSATGVHPSQMWQQTARRTYEMTFQATAAQQTDTDCVELIEHVRLSVQWTRRHRKTLTVEGQRARFCPDGWIVDPLDRFVYDTYTGTGRRIRVDWAQEQVWIEGPVDIRSTRQGRAHAAHMRIDLAQEQIELLNPFPERGVTEWKPEPPF